MKTRMAVLLICSFALFVAAPAFAVPYSFDHLYGEDSNITNGLIGEAQLSLEVTESNSQILFTFSNSGPEACSITDIYFDDDVPLLAFADIFDPVGVVLFSAGASPPNLPGGNFISFSSNYAFDSDPKVQPNGINPGESLGIYFNYVGDSVFDTVISALNTGTMSIGLHVQGFGDGGSESFTAAPVPEPATVLLLTTGLVGLLASKRKRLKK